MRKVAVNQPASFSYVIHQGTEDSDLQIIHRDLHAHAPTQSGKLSAGAWCRLLLGDAFAPGTHPRQRHELTYRRSSCSCLVCLIRTRARCDGDGDCEPDGDGGFDGAGNGVGPGGGGGGGGAMMFSTAARRRDPFASGPPCDAELSDAASVDALSSLSSSGRTPSHSAMANFVVRHSLPSTRSLQRIGGSASRRVLEIGSVVRLNSRASAKLKFTDDVRELFGHLAYTGPISHEEVYRRVTTIGVHYYLYNKGKKARKVYIQGELIQLPLQLGVVRLGTQPMYLSELGATYCLHRKQTMSIYVGEIVLEGNTLGSFINTGIRYYIGFGEERGVCAVYPNRTLGKPRKLGVNELLLHHHMVEDLEVKCL